MNIVARMQGKLGEAVDGLEARMTGLQRKQEQLATWALGRMTTIAADREAREVASLAEMRERVLVQVRAGRLETLTRREAKAAAQMLSALGPTQMGRLLGARPELWGTFVEELLRSWDALDALPSPDAFLALAADAPDSVEVLDRRARAHLLHRDGPRWLAARASWSSLDEARVSLERHHFKARWSYAAQALAHAARGIAERRGFEAVWRELATAPALASTLLPQATRAGAPWFFGPAPPPRSGSTIARALFVAQALESMQSGRASLDDRFVGALLESELADPRVLPVSRGWSLVREAAPAAYETFLQSLIRDDLALFFEHAMHEPPRRDFWLHYLPSIRRTVCVMPSGIYRGLASRLATSDAKTRAALGRARQFTSGDTSAFCLYFDRIVVVEFSKTGNAAYVYARSEFESRMEAQILDNQVLSLDDLKERERADRLSHRGAWERKAHEYLRGHGILPAQMHASMRPPRPAPTWRR